MIDLRALRADPERVRDSQRARGEDPGLVDELLAADARRRGAVGRADELRARQRELGRQVRSVGADQRTGLLADAAALASKLDEAERELAEAEAAWRAAHLAVPNVVDPRTPAGGPQDFVVLAEGGERRSFDFPVRDHLDLGERLGAIDVPRAAKVSGARFAYLTGVGALLEYALVSLALGHALEAGLTPVVPPVLVGPAAMEGTGFLGAHGAEVYRLRDDDLYLVGTSEVALAGMHAGEVFDAATLPVRYAGFSTCFRREAGAHGRDTRGIIRVHQFDKAEMFSFIPLEQAEAEHERLLAIQRRFLEALELPYRVIDVAAGDLGASAARKFDCEAWLPSQERWMEVTSTSNCTDFQARRLGIRLRSGGTPATGESTPGRQVAATLNGTLCAIGRTIVALLENHQLPDARVWVPGPLRPYLGGREVLSPEAP